MVKQKCEIDSFTASDLIADFRNQNMSVNKNVENIACNQDILIQALEIRKSQDKEFILDGHFCLLNKSGNIERISFITFQQLYPEAIVLLTENPEVIIKRRFERDGIVCALHNIEQFQQEEKQYAIEVAHQLNIPIFTSKGSTDLEKAVEFIYTICKGELHER